MLLGVSTILAAASAFQLDRLRYDEPVYDRIAGGDGFEVRRYGARIVAETVARGDRREATREGFRRLAGYIFGDNRGARSISMTTPVEAAAVGAAIDMTTPVTAHGSEDGWTIRFTMPRPWSLSTLPLPTDPRITLRELPEETFSVLRFSGRASAADFEARARRLRSATRAAGFDPGGEPVLAQYDPPWVLGPFRRNEILIPLQSSLVAEATP